MSRLKLIVPAALVLGGFLAGTVSYGKTEYTKQTKKACTYCHVDAKKAPKELTAPGKYYEQKKTLDGYQEKK